MITILNACTCELDNPEKAVQDIHDQIDIKNGLLKNTVALLFCHIKFIETGIMESICKSLPFDVLGCTSMYFAMPPTENMPARSGEIMLTVTVLTSNDVEFAAGICDPLAPENAEDRIHEMYRKTASALGGAPSLAFAFPPTIFNLTIDIMTSVLDKACGGIPVFGTVALDVGKNIRSPKTIFRGGAYSDRMALLLFKGEVQPRFFFLRFPEKSALAQDAIITAASGPELISINNKPAASFLEGMGILNQNGFTQAIPLVIEDSNGANAEVVVVQNVSSEGALICGRHVKVGGILNIGAITSDYVFESARALVRDIKNWRNGEGLFIISCFLRSIVLGEGSAAEVKLIQQELGSMAGTYLYLNSGGELCPKYMNSGDTVNQALQYTIIACLL